MTSSIEHNHFSSSSELFTFARTHLSKDLFIAGSKITILTQKHLDDMPVFHPETSIKKYDVKPLPQTTEDIITALANDPLSDLYKGLIGRAGLRFDEVKKSAVIEYFQTLHRYRNSGNLLNLFESLDDLKRKCIEQKGYQSIQSIQFLIKVPNPSVPGDFYTWTCLDANPGKWCNSCHEMESTALKILDCGRCHFAGYCSSKCQDNDEERHAKLCSSSKMRADRTNSVTSSLDQKKPYQPIEEFTSLKDFFSFAEKTLSRDLLIYKHEIAITSLEKRDNREVSCPKHSNNTYFVHQPPQSAKGIIASMENERENPRAKLLLKLMEPPTWGSAHGEEKIINRYIRDVNSNYEKGWLPALRLKLKQMRRAAVQTETHQLTEKIAIGAYVLDPNDPSVLRTWTCIVSNPGKCCHECGETETTALKLQECARCHIASYCGKPCQTIDWERHKKLCKSKP
jgi:hypothetical protein